MDGTTKVWGGWVMKEKEILERVKVLFKAFIEMYEAQGRTPYEIS